MADSSPPTQGPRLADPASIEPDVPDDFVPLRLLLQPGGLCVEINRPNMLIGRHSTADVRMCLPDISRRHCRCIFEAGRWKIVDQNSLNGTFVNGQRQAEAVLRHGDTLRIGSLHFLVDLKAGTPTILMPTARQRRKAS
jgi:pSer/pThr/pTyr-binding forkhead associated (FHA) protein